MRFVSIEAAHDAIKNYVLAFIDLREWTTATCTLQVLGKMATGTQWFFLNEEKIDTGGFEHNPNAIWAGLDAAIYLRDEHLCATGRRIWGLTFTLYPDGQFNIEYDYNKPADYADSDADGIDATGPVASLLSGLLEVGLQASLSPASGAGDEHQFLVQALRALQVQTASNHKGWELGTEAHWNLDMNAGTLQLSFSDGRTLVAPVQVVGTFNTKNNTFMWGWDHPSVPERLRRAAQRVRDYGAQHQLDRFASRNVVCTQDEAWAFTAAAAQLDEAEGAYRGDASGTWVYMTFGTPKIESPLPL